MFKSNKNKKFLLISIILIAVISSFLLFIRKVNYIPTPYEKELIDYFKEIALQSEYDNNPEKIIKWKESMLLYVVKEKEFKPQISVIKKVIDNINRLTTDGFKIILTDNYAKSNSILYLCNREQVYKSNKDFYEMLTKDIDYDIAGLAYTEFSTKTHTIDKALIFINSEYSFDIQEATILEEITQSLGLAFDSKLYTNSVFYKEKSKQKVRVKKYSQLDKDIVRLLYHPKMKPGLDSIEVERVIKKILKLEKIKLDG
ncbi:DUF2927 domain-containing protein [Polaribacter cellanae]|uniref:DUF2927 domain-containing protein n=1 Tax=Polaribacter cellanae TaxID=2818493 RepID=A0A975H837_9FLAO|nr:DUF2927 domain-containing protein [Polaribacter cellanae]QTE21180.1 DUF2927 domain-containing protein [Polaribacter cellanae]QTE21190.1 DUF2927 domain-containing protein [Polaribacter cellanae]